MTTAFVAEPRRVPPGQRQPRPPLTVVPSHRPRPAKMPFVLLVVTFLAAGLIALLMLNTKLAENSFRLQNLQTESTQLAEQEQALRQEVAVNSSPQRLAELAKRHGMVPKENPAFIDTRSGKVLGQPKPGAAGPVAGPVVGRPARR
jgi:cell division protein FtsL